MLIAKNPCMHPGDVRIVEGTLNPLLARYHFDCVVFPAKGPRPFSDMCSGSDLDGDLYFISWDPALLPPTLHPPMDYTPEPPQEVEGRVQVEDLHEFMVNFIANDQLGTIANAHVAHADLSTLGVCDPLCMRLAYVFSMAVDFPKTGAVPTFPRDARVEKWPDFMQKLDQPSYPSRRIIGRMYRRVLNLRLNRLRPTKVQMNPALAALPCPDATLGQAREAYQEYAHALCSLLALFGVRSEAAIFAGALLNTSILGREDPREAMEVK